MNKPLTAEKLNRIKAGIADGQTVFFDWHIEELLSDALFWREVVANAYPEARHGLCVFCKDEVIPLNATHNPGCAWMLAQESRKHEG